MPGYPQPSEEQMCDTKKFHPLVYKGKTSIEKKTECDEYFAILEKSIKGDRIAEITLGKLRDMLIDLHKEEDELGSLKIVHLRLRRERTIALRCGLISEMNLHDLQRLKVLNWLVSFSWVFAVVALFTDEPICSICVGFFTLFSLTTVGCRLLGVDTHIEFLLMRQFHHIYKLFQGIMFAVTFGLICKFQTPTAVVFGFSVFLWIWFVCSIDAFMMTHQDKVRCSLIITAANIFLAVYVALPLDVNDKLLHFNFLENETLTVSMSTTCLNAVVQITLLSANAIMSLKFKGESSINILVEAPMLHCIAALYSGDEKKLASSLKPAKDGRSLEIPVRLSENTGWTVDFIEDSLDSESGMRSGFTRL